MPLSPSQQLYAASDAWLGLRTLEYLHSSFVREDEGDFVIWAQFCTDARSVCDLLQRNERLPASIAEATELEIRRQQAERAEIERKGVRKRLERILSYYFSSKLSALSAAKALGTKSAVQESVVSAHLPKFHIACEGIASPTTPQAKREA